MTEELLDIAGVEAECLKLGQCDSFTRQIGVERKAVEGKTSQRIGARQHVEEETQVDRGKSRRHNVQLDEVWEWRQNPLHPDPGYVPRGRQVFQEGGFALKQDSVIERAEVVEQPAQ